MTNKVTRSRNLRAQSVAWVYSQHVSKRYHGKNRLLVVLSVIRHQVFAFFSYFLVDCDILFRNIERIGHYDRRNFVALLDIVVR
jgi:hypothetical protein